MAAGDIDDILSALDESETTEVPESWAQGRAVYGGLVAALGLRRASAVAGPRPARAIHTLFTAPTEVGSVDVRARVVRAGRAATSVEARVEQAGAERALVRVVLGEDRPSKVRVEPSLAPAFPAPDALPPIPYFETLAPAFSQWFDYRWVRGELPFSGGTETVNGGYVRLRKGSVAGAEAVLLLMDAWPAPALALLDRPVPASSMAWSVDLTSPAAATGAALATDWWQYDSWSEGAGEGYCQMACRMWTKDGRLCARGGQTVAVFG